MDLVTPLMQTLQANADLERTQAVTQDVRALAQQRMLGNILSNVNLQQQIKTNQAMQDAYSSMGVDPRFTQVAPDPNDDPVTAARKATASLRIQAQQQFDVARRIRAAGGSPTTALAIEKDGRELQYRAEQVGRQGLQEYKDIRQELASSAAGVLQENDQGALDQFVDYARQMNPQGFARMKFDVDALGKPVLGPLTSTTLNGVRSAGITANQQSLLEQKAQRLEQQERDLQRKRDYDDSRTQLNDARVALAQAQGNLAMAREYRAYEGTTAKPKDVVTKPVNREDREAAMDAVESEFPDQKWEKGAKARFASDLAARTNKIVADSKRAGNELGVDEARDQALEELKANVTKSGGKEGFLGFFSEPPTASYKKGAPAEGGVPKISSQAEYDKLKPGDQYIWNGKTLIKK